MSCANNYILEYVPDNLPWYEHDGVMAYCECDNFIKDTGSHSENSRIVNFDIIYKQARGEKIDPDLLKKYKTIDSSRIDQ